MEETIKEILSEFFNEKEVLRRLPNHLKLTGNGFTIAKLLKKFDKEGAKLAYKTKIENDKRKGTLEGYIHRYGEMDGPIKYKEKNAKLSVSESALRLNGKTDAEIQDIKKNHANHSAITEENLIQRYGEVKGRELYSNVQVRDLQFFIGAGWSLEEYEDLIERKTFGWSVEGYIEKYGKEDGLNRWLIDKKKGSDINWFISKYGEERGRIEYAKVLKARTEGGARNSKIQIKFSTALFELLPDYLRDSFYGSPISKDFWMNFESNEFGIKCCIPDIRIHNVLIEFDGDYWHSREETVIRDAQKTILLTGLGYSIYRVKENNYNANEKACLTAALKFIEKNMNSQYKQNFKRKE